jgi:hypothetical protein
LPQASRVDSRHSATRVGCRRPASYLPASTSHKNKSNYRTGYAELARQAVDSAVKEIDDARFKELEKAGSVEVAFIYFYDYAVISEDFEALDRLTLNLIGRAPLYRTRDDDMAKRFRVYTCPKFMVVRDGRRATTRWHRKTCATTAACSRG